MPLASYFYLSTALICLCLSARHFALCIYPLCTLACPWLPAWKLASSMCPSYTLMRRCLSARHLGVSVQQTGAERPFDIAADLHAFCSCLRSLFYLWLAGILACAQDFGQQRSRGAAHVRYELFATPTVGFQRCEYLYFVLVM